MFIKSSLRGQKVHKSMNFVHDLATPSACPVIFILKFVYPTRAMEYILYFMAHAGHTRVAMKYKMYPMAHAVRVGLSEMQ